MNAPLSVTPKIIIKLVLSRKTKEAKFRPYETRFQKISFFTSLGFIGFGALTALLNYFIRNFVISWIGLGSLFLSEITAIVYQISSIAPEFSKLRNIEHEISNPLLNEFDKDIDLIKELVEISEEHHLSYAQKNFELMAKQLRERISILVGAIDKIGVIPLAITSYFSILKIQQDKLPLFGGIEWLSVAIVFLYLLAIRMTGTAQWMERVSEIYQQALKVKSKKDKARSG